MFITELHLKNFRNYKESIIPFQKRLNIIVGNNGQGKTNLLEGIYILSMGKSFRTKNDREMIGFEEEFFRVKGEFIKNGRNLTVEMIYSRMEKLFKIDGIEKKKNADLLENVYTVIFSPEDIRTIKGEPDKRRKFLDRQLFQLKPLYYKNLVRYKKIISNRNIILKEENPDSGLLDVWDEYMSEFGARIMMERSELIEKLNRISSSINDNITGGKEKLHIEYEPNIKLESSELEQKKIIKKELESRRNKDIERGSTTSGPHRDDLKISIDNIDTRVYGSQGQQRTAALALKLAELKIIKEETGENAILLLDDVLSELDGDRQNYLINTFKDNQIFISAADISERVLEKLPEGKISRVSNGSLDY